MDIKRFALGGFKNHKDDELLVRATTVLQAMDNNVFFATPEPALATVTPLVNDFQEKLANCRRKGSPQDTAAKNASRETLCRILKQLAFYVSQVANGDLSILLSSGFVLSSYPRNGNVPEVVRGVIVRDARQSGQMRLDFQKQSQVLLYEYRYAREAAEGQPLEWLEPLSTSSSRANIIAPVTPFNRYWLQVRAVNSYGKSDWSEPVSHFVR